MKNWVLIMSAACTIIFTNCTKDDNAVNPSQDASGNEIQSRSPNFVTLCHQKEDGTFEVKQVNANAVQAHLNHGDYLLDVDLDGYTAVGACSGSANDCDDHNAVVHPGAAEICDGIDNDCDGLIDDADPGIEGQTTWFNDADGDGYGSTGVFTHACYQPSGFVLNSSDCNDLDPSIHPGATEIPNDGIDQNCNGLDSVVIVFPHCDCFSMEELQEVYTYTPWPFGWWSDVPGSCKPAPYTQLMEVWLTNVGQPSQNFNFSAQAGTINGNPFASFAKFNHLTGQYDKLCGGYTNAQNASNCSQILHAFINQMRNSHPTWDYCVRFP